MGWFDWLECPDGYWFDAMFMKCVPKNSQTELPVLPAVLEKIVYDEVKNPSGGVTNISSNRFTLELEKRETGVWFKTCAPAEGGYFYILKPSDAVLGDYKADIPKSSCREDFIEIKFFDEVGTYRAKIADYNNITIVEKTFIISQPKPVIPRTPTAPPASPEQKTMFNDITVQIIAGLIVAVVLYLVLKQK